MRIDTEANVLETSGLKKTTQFSIANNAVAYQALSDGLYANKIGTIIREVGSNAYDAHVAAGKEDVPFFVHLPTVLEPYLEIKDEGVGLSPDDIEEFYTRYFGSNKRDTNDQTGGFGLGSKSPFLYTKNFTVTSVHHGKKYTYGMYKNDIGEFSCSLITERDSNECNGVSVKVDVQRADFIDFENEAKNIYRWFPTYPKVNKDLEFKDKPIVLQGTDWILHGSNNNGRYNSTSSLHVRQGCVAYPVDSKYIDTGNAVLANCDLIITFDIGDLSIVLSRESLSYDDKTIKNLNDKLEKIKRDIHTQITKDVTKAKTFIEACKLLAKVYQDNSTYSFNRFLKTKDVFWNGQKVTTSLSILCDRLDSQANITNPQTTNSNNYDMTCHAYVTNIDNYQMSYTTLKVNSKPIKNLNIDITRRCLIVINDIPRGLPGRLKAHMEKEGLIATTDRILILHDNDDQFNFKPGIKKLLAYLEIEKKDIIYASALDKLTLKKRVYIKNIEYFKPDGNIGYKDKFDVADPVVGGYYIPITSNAMDDDPNRKVRALRSNVQKFMSLLSSLPTPSPITRVYKIPATQRNTKAFKDNKRWINFWEYLDKEMPKLIQKNSKEYYKYMEYKLQLEHNNKNKPSNIQTAILRLKTKKNCNKLKNMYIEVTPILTEVKPIHKNIKTVLQIYDNINYEAFKKKNRNFNTVKNFEEVYPMLEDLYIPMYGDPSDDTTKKILDYIELVDNYRILTKGKI